MIESTNGTTTMEGVIDLGQFVENDLVATLYSASYSNVSLRQTMKVACRTVGDRRTDFRLVEEGSTATYKTNMLRVTKSKHVAKGVNEINVGWVDVGV